MAGAVLEDRRVATPTKESPGDETQLGSRGRRIRRPLPKAERVADVERTHVPATPSAVPAPAGWIARLAARAIVVAMFICSLVVWTVLPALIIFALPRLVDRNIGIPLVLVCVFCGMAAMLKVVALLYGLYRRVMALSPPPPSPPTWRRDSCEPTRIRRRATVLEAVLTLSVIASVIALCTWFLTMAHCSQALCGA